MIFKRLIFALLRRLDIEILRNASSKFPVELSEFEKSVLKKVKPLTMTTPNRLAGVALGMKYIALNEIKGDVVEAGVWAGGSIGAAALIGVNDKLTRKYWLYDTFEGMNRPSFEDTPEALEKYLATKHKDDEGSTWCEVNENQVRANLASLGVDLSMCNFVAGPVEKTLVNGPLPKKIALLRLDTDWYESTLIELQVLFPKLVKGGVLIIDDYGHWQGARRAVDEYFEGLKFKPLLIPLDYTGRICVKIN